MVVATRAGAPLQTLLGWRYAVGATLLAVLLAAERVPLPPRGRRLPLVLLGLVGQGLIGWLGLFALVFIPPATSVFLFYSYPVWVTILAAARRIEPITRRKVIALVLAVTGIAILVGTPAELPDPRGVALALGAALVYAAYIPLMERAAHGVAPTAAALLVSVGAAVTFLSLAAATGTIGARLAPIAWGVIIILGAVATAMAFRLFIAGLAVIGPVRTAIISTVEPISAALFAWAILGQRPGLGMVVGGALILAAVMLLQAPSGRLEPRAAG